MSRKTLIITPWSGDTSGGCYGSFAGGRSRSRDVENPVRDPGSEGMLVVCRNNVIPNQHTAGGTAGGFHPLGPSASSGPWVPEVRSFLSPRRASGRFFLGVRVMRRWFRFSRKPPVAVRLLGLRESAGGDEGLHARYHRLVNRYQRWLLRWHAAHGRRFRFFSLRFFRQRRRR